MIHLYTFKPFRFKNVFLLIDYVEVYRIPMIILKQSDEEFKG